MQTALAIACFVAAAVAAAENLPDCAPGTLLLANLTCVQCPTGFTYAFLPAPPSP
jgi:hypothetical protein